MAPISSTLFKLERQMSYKQALEAAGAKVNAFKGFGSYQGEWYALVDVGGRIGWIRGYYGSCSGCDAFEAEFGFEFSGEFIDGAYVHIEDERHPRHDEYAARLTKFGSDYLDQIMTQEEAEAEAGRNSDWDLESGDAVAWIASHASPLPHRRLT